MLGINAAKGFDYGMGFDCAGMRGSQAADLFTTRKDDGAISTLTNNSGGIQGGISNGMDIYFRVAFKPVATLLTEIPTVDDCGLPVTLKARGRHDPCVLPPRSTYSGSHGIHGDIRHITRQPLQQDMNRHPYRDFADFLAGHFACKMQKLTIDGGLFTPQPRRYARTRRMYLLQQPLFRGSPLMGWIQ